MTFNILSLAKSQPTHRLTRLEFLVLLTLKKNPLHGYGIMKKLKKKIPGVWEPKSGSLYPILQRMVKKGMLKTKEARGLKKYSLTEKGKEAVNQYIKAWKELYRLFKEMNK